MMLLDVVGINCIVVFDLVMFVLVPERTNCFHRALPVHPFLDGGHHLH